jgi:hypothetical protein
MSLPQLVDRAAAIAAVLAELDVDPHEPRPDHAARRSRLCRVVRWRGRPTDTAAAGRPAALSIGVGRHCGSGAARVVLASPDQVPSWATVDTEPVILINGPDGPWVAALRLR